MNTSDIIHVSHKLEKTNKYYDTKMNWTIKKAILILSIILFSISFAIGQTTHTISIDDRNAAIELTRNAILDMNSKNYSQAFNKLRKSIEIDSLFRDAYLRIYQLYTLTRENTEESIETLKKGKRIFEEDDELIFYCGEIYRLNAKMDEAIYEYSKAIDYAKINGEDFYLVPYYYLNRGNLFLASEKLESAIHDYNYLLKLDSSSASGLTNRGITYFKLGEKDKACKDWNMAIKIGSKKANEYYRKHCTD